MQVKVSGMWTATKKLADGSVSYYAYAFKGGPLIAKGKGRDTAKARADLERILALPETMAKLAAAKDVQVIRPAPSVNYIAGLVSAYLKSPEFAKLALVTQREYRRYLDSFSNEFGDWRTALFEDPRIAQDMAEWRDSAAGARTGDLRMSVVSRLFSWARSRGITNARPTDAIERIHKVDRSDLIWEPQQLAALLTASPEPVQWAVRLAAETGLRKKDLIALPWSAVSDLSIRWRTSKRKKDTVIPITPALKALLAEIPRRSPVILTSSKGRPWTSSGLDTAFGRAREKSKVEDRTWHDLRGTAVTRLAMTRLTLRDIARIIGWSEARVEAVMIRYVSADALAAEMLARMSGEHPAQTDYKPHS